MLQIEVPETYQKLPQQAKVYTKTADLCSSLLEVWECGQTQLKYQKATPKVPRFEEPHPIPTEDPQVKSQSNNSVAQANNDIVLDAEGDVEDWWNQMDALTELPTTHDVRISSETQWLPDYVSPETAFY